MLCRGADERDENERWNTAIRCCTKESSKPESGRRYQQPQLKSPPEQIQTQAQQPQLKYSRRASTGKAKNAANQTPEKSMEDFMLTIALALEEGSIHEKKTTRLYECLDAGSWSEVAYTLLCENIPLKRKGKGYYACRVCQVPKKGHDCMYCDICSTPNDKHEKTDVHVCINCPRCFKIGKRNKKLVQIRSMGHECPHAM